MWADIKKAGETMKVDYSKLLCHVLTDTDRLEWIFKHGASPMFVNVGNWEVHFGDEEGNTYLVGKGSTARLALDAAIRGTP